MHTIFHPLTGHRTHLKTKRYTPGLTAALVLFLTAASVARAATFIVDESAGNSPLTVLSSPESFDELVIGTSQGGAVSHLGNTLTANTIRIGRNASGTYTLSGGVSTTTGTVHVGVNPGPFPVITGTFDQTGGEHNAGAVVVGHEFGGATQYKFHGGTFNFGSLSVISVAPDWLRMDISSGANGNVAGQLTITNSRVSVNGGTLSVGSIVVSGSGIIDVTDPNGSTSALTIGSDDSSCTLAATLQDATGPGGFTKIGTGTLTIGQVQPFSGPTRVLGGTLVLDNTGHSSTVLNPASAVTVSNATLRLQGQDYNVIAPVSLTVGTGGKVEAGNTLRNAHTLQNVTLLGGELANTEPEDLTYGNYVLIGTLTAGGGVNSTISAAKFQLHGTRVFDVASGASLTIGALAQLTDANGGTQIGSLTKTGSGTMRVHGATTYTGGTLVSAGTLLNNGTMAGAVEVTSTIGGTGTFTGAVNINSGGTLAPGDGAVGTLTANTLTMSSGSLMRCEFKADGNDVANVTASNGFTINGGSISLFVEGTSTPFTTVGTYSLFTYTGTLGGSVGNLSIANPDPARIYTFSNDTANQRVVLIVATPPAITSANHTEFQTAVASYFSVTTTGYPPPTITRNGTLPAGLTFTDNNDGTATISGTSAAGTGGVYALVFGASNGIEPAATQEFTLTVNQPPAITSGSGTSFIIGTNHSFTFTTTGYPSGTISLSGILPNGITFTNNGDGTATLAGTPAAGTRGSYSLTWHASNGIGSPVSQNFTLTVIEPNVITSVSEATFERGAPSSFTVTASGVPAPQLSASGTLPGGVTFTDHGNGTATLGGTPQANGVYPLTITAANGVAPNATQQFTFTVIEPNVITSASEATFQRDAPFSFTVTASGVPAPQLSASGTLPGGVTFTDHDNGTATLGGTPQANGVYPLTITAANGVAPIATQQFILTIAELPATDATLSDLVLSAGPLTPAFATYTFHYAGGAVPNTVNSLTLTPTATRQNATLQVNGQPVASGTASSAIPLSVGTNTIVTVCTAADGQSSRTYTVTVLRRAAQTISFAPLPEKTFGDPAFALSATASSGLPPVFTILSGPATISSNVVTITGLGPVTVRASQGGDVNHDPAPPVDQSFTVVQPFAGTLLPTSADAPGSSIYVTAVQPDGKIVVAGQSRPIVRFNADGTLDEGFTQLSPAGRVYCIVVQPDGKLLAGGDFPSIDRFPRNHLARLNADGTLDETFEFAVNGPVRCMAVQKDGKLLLGGEFTSPRNRVARLNADGTLDTSYDVSASGIAVFSLAVQGDGKVLLGGLFGSLQANGATEAIVRRGIARLNPDGSLDADFAPMPNVSQVNCVALQADGKVLLGGNFTSLQPNGAASATTRNRIARVHADGTLDDGFDPNANGGLWGFAPQADGKVLIYGSFTSLRPNGAVSATPRQRIARLHPDGSLDIHFDPKANGTIYSAALRDDGTILLGGDFTSLQPNGDPSPTSRRLAWLNNDPATQSLTAPDTSLVFWTRGGTAAEIEQVTFESSADGGSTWVPLGSATRAGNRWHLSGLSLAGEGHLRARGRTSGGIANATSGLIEQISAYQAPAPLTLQITGVADAVYNSTTDNTSVAIQFSSASGQSLGMWFSSDLSTWLAHPTPVNTGATGDFTVLFTAPGNRTALWQQMFFRASRE